LIGKYLRDNLEGLRALMRLKRHGLITWSGIDWDLPSPTPEGIEKLTEYELETRLAEGRKA
jgi:hypothetical protein